MTNKIDGVSILETMADVLLDKCAAIEKAAFVPGMPGGNGMVDPNAAAGGPPVGAPPQMDPAMMAGGGPQPDPAMGSPAAPMDPSQVMAGGGAPPMDPAMMAGGGAPPMDPSMMAAGGAPAGAAPPPAPADGSAGGNGGVNPELLMSMMGMMMDQAKEKKEEEPEPHNVPQEGVVQIQVKDLRLFFTEIAGAIAHHAGGLGGAPTGKGGGGGGGDGKPDLGTIKSVAKMEQVHRHLEDQLKNVVKQVQDLASQVQQGQAKSDAMAEAQKQMATAAPAAGAQGQPVQSAIPGIQPMNKGVDMTIPSMAQQAMQGVAGGGAGGGAAGGAAPPA